MTADLDAFLTTMIGHPVAIAAMMAEDIVHRQYGIEARAERLTGERDENFKMTAGDGSQFVFKVANATEDPLITELPTAALLHVEAADPELPCPRVVRSQTGKTHIGFTDAAGLSRTARLVTYLQGKPLASSTRSIAQRAACGRLAARLGRALRNFEHPASRRPLIWDVRVLPKLSPLLEELPNLEQADLIRDLMGEFATRIAPRLDRLRQQFIHNDLNSRNVLVDPADEAVVTGIIDFGDAQHNALIVDVAIAAVAQITATETAAQATTDLVRGYHAIEPLQPAELDVLYWLIAARMVMGVLIPTWHRARNPGAEHFPAFDADYLRNRFELIRSLTTLKPIHV